MAHTPRIGLQIGLDDPFWVQVREVMWERAQALGVAIVEISIQGAERFSADEQIELVEGLLAQDLSALICNTYPYSLLQRILARDLPIVYVSEIALRHPRFVSRTGLFDAGRMLGALLADRLPAGRRVLILNGYLQGEDPGQSRIDGFLAGLPPGHRYEVDQIATDWSYEDGRRRAAAWLEQHPGAHVDAIFGLSDSLALAARDVFAAHGRLAPGTPLIGVNGDPLALAAVANGQMLATVETDVEDIASQAIALASQAARGERLPDLFSNVQRLVTAENVSEVALRKLISLASLPTRLVGVNRRNEQLRVTQLETSVAIDRQVGLILDPRQLSAAITDLIRGNYGFDQARLLLRDPETGRLTTVGGPGSEGAEVVPDPDGPLAYVLAQRQAVFIPDVGASYRFGPDPLFPTMRARVVVPVRLGGHVTGLLDLHSGRVAQLTREEVAGLQLLADQLGIALRNAELYGEAVRARGVAEQADKLKTTLLANVSHELRTPLNVILGYSQTALDSLGAGAEPEALAHDLRQIYRSGEHLLRLINDLLDLSRAEIGELDLQLRRIETRAFLAEVFRDVADALGGGRAVEWRLELPGELPPVEADPVRLRQILLNLLHNAHKFTERGSIALGAEALPGALHLWVADTGVGIGEELREQIFDPFVRGAEGPRRSEGIGLGLSISRQLVVLHRGQIGVESTPGAGTTFHVRLPLPAPSGLAPAAAGGLLLISEAPAPPAYFADVAARRGMPLHMLRPGDDIAGALRALRPALLAWDFALAPDGARALEQLRAGAGLAEVPLLLGGEGEAAPTGVLLKPVAEAALLSAAEGLGASAHEGCILVVEDDPRVRALHCRLIAERFPGRRILEAGDGRAALAELARETPALVVLDLMMPELDGFGVVEALRADRRTAEVPVLVLSGRPLSADDIRRLSAARVVVQTKDMLAPDELAESMRRTLEQADALPQQTSALVKAAVGFIHQRYGEPLTRQMIADSVGVSKDYLGRIFQQELGLAPWEYLIRYRVLRAKELLRATSRSVTDIAAAVGFDTATYFSTIFHREVGCSPREYRAAGRNPATLARDP